jgi:hypothetical protein
MLCAKSNGMQEKNCEDITDSMSYLVEPVGKRGTIRRLLEHNISDSLRGVYRHHRPLLYHFMWDFVHRFIRLTHVDFACLICVRVTHLGVT